MWYKFDMGFFSSSLARGVCSAAVGLGWCCGVGVGTADAAGRDAAAAEVPGGATQTEQAARAEAEIRFFAERAARDPADHLTPTRLGQLLIRQARRTGDTSLYARAEQALGMALERNPAYQPAKVGLASAYLARHRFAEALEMAGQAVEADPDDPEARGVLGDALLETGDLDGAEVQYGKVVKAAPGLFAYSRLANLRHARGDAGGAVEAFGEALAQGEAEGAPAEDRAWCLVQMGRISFERGDWAAAERHYQAAAELVPGGYAAMEHLGELRAAQKDFDQAVALYQKVVAAAPRPEFFQALGDVYVAAGRAAEAKPWHDKALRAYLEAAEAGDGHYFHHLAGFYADVAKDGEEAVKWARRDVALRRTVWTLDGLAWALHAAGQYLEAAAVMDEALGGREDGGGAGGGGAGGGGGAHVLYHASLIYFKAGNAAKAKDCLQRAALANPKFREFHVHR